jgi:hypothetical protein
MADGAADGNAPNPPQPQVLPGFPRAAFEHTEEVMQVLKTAFPLLIQSLRAMTDQFHYKFRPSPEEDVYLRADAGCIRFVVCPLPGTDLPDILFSKFHRPSKRGGGWTLNADTINVLSRDPRACEYGPVHLGSYGHS